MTFKSKVSQALDAKKTIANGNGPCNKVSPTLAKQNLGSRILKGPHMFSESKVKISFVYVIVIYHIYI